MNRTKEEILDELIEGHLRQFTEQTLFRASAERWMQTGKASGSFRASLHAMLQEYADQFKPEAMEVYAQQKWISVGDKLPKIRQRVLVCPRSRCTIAIFRGDTNRTKFWESADRSVTYTFRSFTHWQPLPTPPPYERNKK